MKYIALKKFYLSGSDGYKPVEPGETVELDCAQAQKIPSYIEVAKVKEKKENKATGEKKDEV